MRNLRVLATVVALLGLMAVGEKQAAAFHRIPPPCNYPSVDGVIGPEWIGVTPIFVPYQGFPGGTAADGQLVGFNVYVRVDANCFYMAFQAVPTAGDQWDDAWTLGLGSSVNIYLDTDVDGDSDLIIETLAGDYCEAPNCNNVVVIGDPALGPHVWSVGNQGAPSPASVGGVREVGIPWDTLQTDPDGVGFALTTCSVNLRTVQAFGYNFSGSQFPNRFGTYSQPGCVPPSTPGKASGGGKIVPSSDPSSLDVVLELATLLIGSGSSNASIGDPATFGFSVMCCPSKGNLQYNDHDASVQIKATSITSLTITAPGNCVGGGGKHAEIHGMAKVNGTTEGLKVDVDDCGEPGSGDTFSIATDSYSASGRLIGGNIQIQD